MKIFLLIFSYGILLIHNCVPHHHHAFKEDLDTKESSHHDHHSHGHNVNDHHSHSETSDDVNQKNSEENHNPFSHYIHALDLSEFVSNNEIIYSEKKQISNDNSIHFNSSLFIEHTLLLSLDFEFRELRYVSLSHDPTGLRGPPIC